MPHREDGANDLRECLRSDLTVDLQSVLKQSIQELRAELKAELENDQRLPRWGDPLDDQSDFRCGLRAELQIQLRSVSLACACADDPRSFALVVEEHRAEPEPDKLVGGGRARDGHASATERHEDDIEECAIGSRGNSKETMRCADSFPSLPEVNLQLSCADCHDAGTISKTPDEPISEDRSLESEPGAAMDSRARRRSSASLHATGTVEALRQATTFERSLPAGRGRLTRLRHKCKELVHHSLYFDVLIGIVIVANAICVGLEIQWDLDGTSGGIGVTSVLEHVCLVVFVMELSVRFLADGSRVRKNNWFLFDAVLVAIGILSTWVLEPLMRRQISGAGAEGASVNDIFSQVLIIRVLRLLRLIRALRLLEQFHELWKLASGLLSSVRTVLSACLLVMITVYIFACLGIELITQNERLLGDVVCREIIEYHFRTVPVSMITLVQFANADSIASIYAPLISKVWYLAIYFGLVWLIITISLMNLVTGVIVDQAISQGSMDRDMEMHTKRKMLRRLTPSIQHLFQMLDKSGDGKLRLGEVCARLGEVCANHNRAGIPELLMDIVQPEKFRDLFAFLDADGSGEIDEKEFMDGVFHLVLQTVPIETTQILHMLRAQARDLRQVKELALAQAYEVGGASLTKDHKSGDRVLNCKLEGSMVKISGGGLSERRPQHPHKFSIRLETPLRHDYPEESTVSLCEAPKSSKASTSKPLPAAECR